MPTSDQFNWCHVTGGKVCSQVHRCMWLSLQVAGPAAMAGRWAGGPGGSSAARRLSPESTRSEVTALGLHVARLPGVAAGQLGEAGGHPGPAVLVQWLSGRGGVTVRRGENGLSGALNTGTRTPERGSQTAAAQLAGDTTRRIHTVTYTFPFQSTQHSCGATNSGCERRFQPQPSPPPHSTPFHCSSSKGTFQSDERMHWTHCRH